MKKIVLIDGSSYLYRAFHALPRLTNPQGEPTGALFGVINMLRSIIKSQPDYLAFVLDASGPTFRDALFAHYKAQRTPMPDELRAQVEPLIKLVNALGVPLLRVDGVEADDVIGTIAIDAKNKGIETTISTGDKDFAQLVQPGIILVNTMSGSRYETDQDVINKFGVAPDRIIDLLALMGDSVDNIPGVEKCGPKTAAKWLNEYGSLQGVIESAADIKGKVGDNLRDALTRLPVNQQLATIKLDVELDVTLDDLVLQAPNKEELRELYQYHGMNQALRELDGIKADNAIQEQVKARAVIDVEDNTVDPAMAEKGEYALILDLDSLRNWKARIKQAGEFAFDTETDSLDAMRANLVGISLSTAIKQACYIPIGHIYPGAPEQLTAALVQQELAELFADPNIRKIGQHGKYDLHVLERHGYEVNNYHDDTMLQSFVLDAGRARHDMDTQAAQYLGYKTIKYEEVAGKGAKQISFAQVAVEAAQGYAAEDADITYRLYKTSAQRLDKHEKLKSVYRDIEMPLVQVLKRIEDNGVLIDTQELSKQSAALGARMLDLHKQAITIAGRNFNLESPKQLQTLLFDELGLPALVKTPKGQPSTNEEALEAIAEQHELPRIILEYRGLAKLRSTYTEKLPEMVNPSTGRVHTSYHQAGAATGRLASSDPNLQNIPIRTEDGRRIRQAFIAPAGRKIVALDYSQIELRIMAHLSQDKGLINAFESGLDVHRATAAEVFAKTPEEVTSDERRSAKAINFGLMYGMSAFGLARNLGIARGQAQDYIQLYFSRYPGVREYMDRTRQQAHENGYVETVFGRRLYLEYINKGTQTQRAGAERAAINAPMQGTAADIIKRAMITVDAWMAEYANKSKMIMQVHDELVFEVDQEFAEEFAQQVKTHMEDAAQLSVPLLVECGIGHTWDEAH